jgi:hypothetical protein
MKKNWLFTIAGFLLLFAVYHFPEFYNALWIAALFKIGFLLASYFVAKWQGYKGLGAFGLGLHKGWLGNLLKGLLTGILFFGLSALLAVLMGFDAFVSVANATAFLKQIPVILLMTVFPSVAEDILTRGYLYAHFKDKLSSKMFMLISATVYVLNHIWRLGDHPAVLIYLFILGLALAYAVWVTGSLWLAFGIHWGSNIAFETNGSLIQTASITTNHESTWMLALCFLLMLVFLWKTAKYFNYVNQL